MTTKVLLDLDTGIDDALAICYTLGSPDLELVGITATFGNVSQTQSVTNALAFLHLLGHDDIPVYPGAPYPLRENQTTPYEPSSTVKAIHGPYGLGPLRLPSSPRPAEKLSAPDALNRLCSTLGAQLAVTATGPLTNLALALDQDPEALAEAGTLSIMGGAYEAPGNVTPYAESNIINDPEAASRVLSGSWHASWYQHHATNQAPIAVGLDVTMKTVLTKERTAQWAQLNETGRILASIVDFYIDAYQRNNPGMAGCALHDPLAVALLNHPYLIKGQLSPVAVALPQPERGRTLMTPIPHLQDHICADKCLYVALEVDAQNATETIVDAIETCLMQCY